MDGLSASMNLYPNQILLGLYKLAMECSTKSRKLGWGRQGGESSFQAKGLTHVEVNVSCLHACYGL